MKSEFSKCVSDPTTMFYNSLSSREAAEVAAASEAAAAVEASDDEDSEVDIN